MIKNFVFLYGACMMYFTRATGLRSLIGLDNITTQIICFNLRPGNFNLSPGNLGTCNKEWHEQCKHSLPQIYNEQILYQLSLTSGNSTMVPLLEKAISRISCAQEQYNFLTILGKVSPESLKKFLAIGSNHIEELRRVVTKIKKIVANTFCREVRNERIDTAINEVMQKLYHFHLVGTQRGGILKKIGISFENFRANGLNDNEITHVFTRMGVLEERHISIILNRVEYRDPIHEAICFLVARCDQSLVHLKVTWSLIKEKNISYEDKIYFLSKCLATLPDETEQDNFLTKIGIQLEMWGYVKKIEQRSKTILQVEQENVD